MAGEIQNPASPPSYPVILWCELIAFDVDAPDYGVAAYLEECGRVPERILLLLWSNDLVHSFDATAGDDAFLRDDCCSYGGHFYGGVRQRQRWRRRDLKSLIAHLQQRGILVYLTIFDQLMTPEWARRNQLPELPLQWAELHPEVCFIDRTGNSIPNICPLKRLADGSFYEDFFAARLVEVLEYFHFDGYHGADGYIHPRLEAYRGDFSDDLVGQFREFRGGELPAETPETLPERAEFIWNHLRYEWIAFLCERNRRFWTVVDAALQRRQLRLIVNSVWTRDPFEAAYRYGVDYRMLKSLESLDGVVVESVSSVLELEEWTGDDMDALFKTTAAVMRLKAMLPDIPLFFMNAVQDLEEQYFTLRHAPARLESEVLLESFAFLFRGNNFRGIFDGFVCCLAGDLRRHEWAFLFECWDAAMAAGRSAEPGRGVTVIWSNAALDRELEHYCRKRHFSSHRLHSVLLACGAPVHRIARIEELEKVSGPIAVLNPEFFTESEREALRHYRRGELFAIGRGGEEPEHFNVPEESQEPDSWVWELPEPAPPPEWVGEKAAVMRLAGHATPMEIPACWVKQTNRYCKEYFTAVSELESGGTENRLLLRNNQSHYQEVELQLPTGFIPRSELSRRIVFFDPRTRETRLKLPPFGAGMIRLEPESGDNAN